MRELLFRVTKSDFTETHIRGSGNGGQNRNKVHTGVRLYHAESGAAAESTTHKSQEQNRKEAFVRIRERPEWKSWFREKVAITSGKKPLEEVVRDLMVPENIRTQVRVDNKWQDVELDDLQG